MFLIRTAFWLSLVILLLPVGNQGNSNVIRVTADALSNMDKFCERNTDICSITQETWKSLKFKAAYSFDALANISKEIKDQASQTKSTVLESTQDQIKTQSLYQQNHVKNTNSYRGQNTLTKNDLEPGWSLLNKKTAAKPST